MVAVLLVVTMLAPGIASVTDHHFAERQPGHSHLGRPVPHGHKYDQDHRHNHYGPASSETFAVYDYETGSPASSVVVTDDKAMMAFLLFQPEATLLLPEVTPGRTAQNYVTPPGKPPPHA